MAPSDPAIIHNENNPSADKWPKREKALTFEEAKKGTEGLINKYIKLVTRFCEFFQAFNKLLVQIC